MWYEQDRWKDRLVVEREIMRQRFPGFVLVRYRDRNLAWHGTVEPIPGHRFEIALHYPYNYPYGEPKVRVRTPALRTGAPHVYGDGTLCVHRKGWNPDPIADSRVRFAAATETGVPRQVTLMSAPTYEQFIISIRDLRAHGICNVAILEAGTPVLGGPQFPGGRDVPTLVLCGNSIGHEGFFGRLAPDTHIRIRLHQPEQ